MTTDSSATKSSVVPAADRKGPPGWAEGLIGQLLAIALSLVGGAVIILMVGENPLHVFATLLRGAFGSTDRIAGSLLQATPIIICGVAACIALRGGLFNIGVEGQLYLGGFAAAWVGFSFAMPPVIHVVVGRRRRDSRGLPVDPDPGPLSRQIRDQ
ncbi:hypothetical protein [Sinorhizobium medicae]